LVTAEGLDPGHLGGDVLAGRLIRGQGGSAQPVVAHHPLLVLVGDRTTLEGRHRREGSIKAWGQVLQVVRVERHPADIQPDLQVLVVPEQVAETPPLAAWIRPIEVGCVHNDLMLLGGVHADGP
jgi:hypothetical protein